MRNNIDICFYVYLPRAVKGPILPKAGDRVLVEAEFNPNAAFKWTATRIQIVNIGGGNMPMNINSGKSSGQQNVQQQQNYPSNASVTEKIQQTNRAVAPPPPIISITSHGGATSRHTTSTSSDGMNYSQVSIISNPHSVYSHSTAQQQQQITNSSAPVSVSSYQQGQRANQANPARGRVVSMGLPMGVGDGLLPLQFNHNSQIPSLFTNTDLNSSVSSVEILRSSERDREREQDRMDSRDREKERDRERERERDKTRAREKDKARDTEKEKERVKDRSRRRSPSPPPKKAKMESWQDRQSIRSERYFI